MTCFLVSKIGSLFGEAVCGDAQSGAWCPLEVFDDPDGDSDYCVRLFFEKDEPVLFLTTSVSGKTYRCILELIGYCVEQNIPFAACDFWPGYEIFKDEIPNMIAARNARGTAYLARNAGWINRCNDADLKQNAEHLPTMGNA